jgi:hypothetical protein
MKTSQHLPVDSSNPQAWIAIQKSRQKVYGSNGKSQVYLKDEQEFQIELFNPTQTKYLVKFKINGSYTSPRGLILNPGQRYFLDRFIDDDKKLAFSTYEVEDTKAAKKAIEKNGLLEVEFYAETFLHGNIISYPRIYNTPNWSQPIWTTNPGTFWCGTSNGIFNNAGGSSTLTLAGSTVNNITYTSGTVTSGTTYTSTSNYSSVVNDASIETGRVEKGEKSGQSFEDGYGTFNSWESYTTTVHIIPLSQKPAETQEIRSYCTGCGFRLKKQTWKFCPNCGEKF